MIDGSPGWQIVRQQLPGTPAADCIKDAVEDFSPAVLGRTATRFDYGHESLQVFPLGIGQVSVVRSAARHRCSPAYGTDSFQTRSKRDVRYVHLSGSIDAGRVRQTCT